MCNLCGSGGSSNTATSTSTSNVLPWVSAAGQDIYNRANTLSQQPYQPYGQPRLAGFTPDTQAAFNITRGNVGSYQPYMNLAGQGAASSLGAFNPVPYMNPYWTQVADRAAQGAMRADDIARAGRNANAVSAGAFGGSRAALQESEAQKNLQDRIADIYLRGGAEAYDRGTSAFFQDADRMRQGASTLGQLGTLQQQLGASDAAALGAIGTQQQQQGQQSLDLAYQDFLKQRDWPKTQLGFVSQMFGGMPSGLTGTSGQTTTTTQPPPSTLGQLGSAALGTYGLYKMLFGGQKAGGPVKRRFAHGGPVRRYEEGGPVDASQLDVLINQRNAAIMAGNWPQANQITATIQRLQGNAVPPELVTPVPPNTLQPGRPTRDQREDLNRRRQSLRSAEDFSPVAPMSPAPSSTLGRILSSRAMEDARTTRPSSVPTPQIMEQAGDAFRRANNMWMRPVERAAEYLATPADEARMRESLASAEDFSNPHIRPPRTPAQAPTLGTMPRDVRANYTDEDQNPSVTSQRPQPVTAIRRPGQRSAGLGSLPTSVQQASAQDAPERPRFLPDMSQPGTPEVQRATSTLQDAMRDNIDRGESILMTAARWAQAASQPGATFMGSLGAGTEAGLTNLRQQRQAARDAERFSQQLDIQRGSLEEQRRLHDLQSQQHAETLTQRERESLRQAETQRATAGAGAGAATSIQLNAIRQAIATANDPNASEQARNEAREFINTMRPSSYGVESRADTAQDQMVMRTFNEILQATVGDVGQALQQFEQQFGPAAAARVRRLMTGAQGQAPATGAPRMFNFVPGRGITPAQ